MRRIQNPLKVLRSGGCRYFGTKRTQLETYSSVYNAVQSTSMASVSLSANYVPSFESLKPVPKPKSKTQHFSNASKETGAAMVARMKQNAAAIVEPTLYSSAIHKCWTDARDFASAKRILLNAIKMTSVSAENTSQTSQTKGESEAKLALCSTLPTDVFVAFFEVCQKSRRFSDAFSVYRNYLQPRLQNALRKSAIDLYAVECGQFDEYYHHSSDTDSPHFHKPRKKLLDSGRNEARAKSHVLRPSEIGIEVNGISKLPEYSSLPFADSLSLEASLLSDDCLLPTVQSLVVLSRMLRKQDFGRGAMLVSDLFASLALRNGKRTVQQSGGSSVHDESDSDSKRPISFTECLPIYVNVFDVCAQIKEESATDFVFKRMLTHLLLFDNGNTNFGSDTDTQFLFGSKKVPVSISRLASVLDIRILGVICKAFAECGTLSKVLEIDRLRRQLTITLDRPFAVTLSHACVQQLDHLISKEYSARKKRERQLSAVSGVNDGNDKLRRLVAANSAAALTDKNDVNDESSQNLIGRALQLLKRFGGIQVTDSGNQNALLSKQTCRVLLYELRMCHFYLFEEMERTRRRQQLSQVTGVSLKSGGDSLFELTSQLNQRMNQVILPQIHECLFGSSFVAIHEDICDAMAADCLCIDRLKLNETGGSRLLAVLSSRHCAAALSAHFELTQRLYLESLLLCRITAMVGCNLTDKHTRIDYIDFEALFPIVDCFLAADRRTAIGSKLNLLFRTPLRGAAFVKCHSKASPMKPVPFETAVGSANAKDETSAQWVETVDLRLFEFSAQRTVLSKASDLLTSLLVRYAFSEAFVRRHKDFFAQFLPAANGRMATVPPLVIAALPLEHSRRAISEELNSSLRAPLSVTRRRPLTEVMPLKAAGVSKLVQLCLNK